MAGEIEMLAGSENDLLVFGRSKPEGIDWMNEFMDHFPVTWSMSIMSADRHGKKLDEFIPRCVNGGTRVFIAMAGMSAKLPAAVASRAGFMVPVLGVPLKGGLQDGLGAVVTIFDQPQGAPVATVGGMNKHGFVNAVLIALQIIAQTREDIRTELAEYLRNQGENVRPAQESFAGALEYIYERRNGIIRIYGF